MIPQSFDPQAGLSSAKNVGDVAVPSVPAETGTSRIPEQYKAEGNTALNIVIGEDTRPIATDGIQRQPSGVDKFGGD